MNEQIEVVHPCWLIATGDQERVEVLRSPLVRQDDGIYRPVREYIAGHGLVLAARETFPGVPEFMHNSVEMSVYVTPQARNNGYAEVGAA